MTPTEIFEKVVTNGREKYEARKLSFPHEKEENRIEYIIDYVIDEVDETEMNHQDKRMFLDSLILELESAQKVGVKNEGYGEGTINYLIFYAERRKRQYENELFLSIAE